MKKDLRALVAMMTQAMSKESMIEPSLGRTPLDNRPLVRNDPNQGHYQHQRPWWTQSRARPQGSPQTVTPSSSSYIHVSSGIPRPAPRAPMVPPVSRLSRGEGVSAGRTNTDFSRPRSRSLGSLESHPPTRLSSTSNYATTRAREDPVPRPLSSCSDAPFHDAREPAREMMRHISAQGSPPCVRGATGNPSPRPPSTHTASSISPPSSVPPNPSPSQSSSTSTSSTSRLPSTAPRSRPPASLVNHDLGLEQSFVGTRIQSFRSLNQIRIPQL